MRLPVLMLTIAYILSIGVDAGNWRIIKGLVGKKSPWPKVYLIFAVITLILLIVITAWPKKGEGEIIPVMWMLFTFISLIVAKVIFLIFGLFAMIPRLWKGRFCKPIAVIGLCLGLLACGFLWWSALVTRNQIEVIPVEIYSERVPEGFNGFRIVQFSDLHVGTWGTDTTFVSRFVDSINAQKPDIIFFTGDIVNRNTKEILPFVKPLSRLKAPYGVWSVLGNHDYGDYQKWPSEEAHLKNVEDLKRIQGEMGWHMLNNEGATLIKGNDTISLLGVENWGEPPFTTHGDLDKAMKGQKEGRFRILLSHNPKHWHYLIQDQRDIDLTLSGHTHAMQVIIGGDNWRWSPSKNVYEEWAGLYHGSRKVNGIVPQIYVNIGAGQVGIPIRMGAAKPEVTDITLYRK